MTTVTKGLRLGGLVLAMGMLAGCGGAGDPADLMEPAHRELEAMGLIHDRGADAYFDSLAALSEQAWSGGNAELADLIIRGGLLEQNIPYLIERATEMEYARVVEVLEAADPETPYRQWDLEARQAAMEAALSDVPEAHRSFVNTACMGEDYAWGDDGPDFEDYGRYLIPPVYMVAQCIETNVDVIVSVVEPEGGRDQFGVWVDRRESAPNRRNYVVVQEASGGAVACLSQYDRIEGRRGHKTLGGIFNDEGALSLDGGFGAITLLVHQQGGEDRLSFGGSGLVVARDLHERGDLGRHSGLFLRSPDTTGGVNPRISSELAEPNFRRRRPDGDELPRRLELGIPMRARRIAPAPRGAHHGQGEKRR